MAVKHDIQYVNFYSSGSAARKIEPRPERKKQVKLPKPRKEQAILLRISPLAVAGTLICCVLLVMLVAGIVELGTQQRQTEALQWYVSQLQQENQVLTDTYHAGYDLNEIRDMALGMGMVPMSELPATKIDVTVPHIPVQPTAWENFWSFVVGLFA